MGSFDFFPMNIWPFLFKKCKPLHVNFFLSKRSISLNAKGLCAGWCTTSWFWRPRSTCGKWRPSTQSGWWSLPPSSSSSPTPLSSASRRSSRRLSHCTTNMRNPTPGESHVLSENSTPKLHSRVSGGLRFSSCGISDIGVGRHWPL